MAVKPVRKPSSASEDEIILWGVKPTPASQFKVGDRVYYHVIKKVTKGNVTADEVERKFGKVVSVGEEGIGIKVPSEPLQYVSKIPLFSLKDLSEVKSLPKPLLLIESHNLIRILGKQWRNHFLRVYRRKR